jgi:hypothetical protein
MLAVRSAATSAVSSAARAVVDRFDTCVDVSALAWAVVSATIWLVVMTPASWAVVNAVTWEVVNAPIWFVVSAWNWSELRPAISDVANAATCAVDKPAICAVVMLVTILIKFSLGPYPDWTWSDRSSSLPMAKRRFFSTFSCLSTTKGFT